MITTYWEIFEGLIFAVLADDHLIVTKGRLTIVFVNVVGVSSMVNTVMRGSVEDPLQWSKMINHLSVDPKLIEKVELLVNNIGRGGNQQRHR